MKNKLKIKNKKYEYVHNGIVIFLHFKDNKIGYVSFYNKVNEDINDDSVLIFENEKNAMKYFERNYIYFKDVIQMCFVNYYSVLYC